MSKSAQNPRSFRLLCLLIATSVQSGCISIPDESSPLPSTTASVAFSGHTDLPSERIRMEIRDPETGTWIQTHIGGIDGTGVWSARTNTTSEAWGGLLWYGWATAPAPIPPQYWVPVPQGQVALVRARSNTEVRCNTDYGLPGDKTCSDVLFGFDEKIFDTTGCYIGNSNLIDQIHALLGIGPPLLVPEIAPCAIHPDHPLPSHRRNLRIFAGNPVCSATDATCDGIDDDCNGLIDDGFGSGPQTCGVGACARTTTPACVNGQIVDECIPGAPLGGSDASCDNVDDDCDGSTDEGWTDDRNPCTLSDACVDGEVTSTPVSGTPECPADPYASAPPPELAPTFGATVEFLFEGPDAVQTNVTPNTIDPDRATRVHGRVFHRDTKAPIGGVRISAVDHPEFGETHSRIDGYFDLVVNGGQQIIVSFELADHLEVQRTLTPSWNEHVSVGEVAMTPLDSATTLVPLDGTTTSHMLHTSTTVEDIDGRRSARVLFPPGVTAQMRMADGSAEPLVCPASGCTFRATEYTVGELGQQAMPGTMPERIAYTYAVELSFDETLDDVISVELNDADAADPQPLGAIVYLDNFLEIPVGAAVPVGTYDRAAGGWAPQYDGHVLRVAGVDSSGLAILDVDDDGPASVEDYDDFGISDAERAILATTYQVGDSIWRVITDHFSPHDYNFTPFLPPGAEAPEDPNLNPGADGYEDPECESGSIIECENRVVGEQLPLHGTGLTLNYRSSRAAGVRAHYKASIPVRKPYNVNTGGLITSMWDPSIRIDIAGRSMEFDEDDFIDDPQDPDNYYRLEFEWDGLDFAGREMRTPQQARVTVCQKTQAADVRSFSIRSAQPGSGGGGDASGNSIIGFRLPARRRLSNVTFGQNITTEYEGDDSGRSRTGISARLCRSKVAARLFGTFKTTTLGLGGWTVDAQHAYDEASGVLYLGDGSSRRFNARQSLTSVSGFTPAGSTPPRDYDGEQASEIELFASDVDYDRDGRLIFSSYHQAGGVYRVEADGTISRIIGNGQFPLVDDFDELSAFDGAPATATRMGTVTCLAAGPDGSIYTCETLGGSLFVIRRRDPEGRIWTFAGAGQYDRNVGCRASAAEIGDGGAAGAATLGNPSDVVVDADGTVYISDTEHCRIRRVGLTGIIDSIIGGGAMDLGVGFEARDQEALQVRMSRGPSDIALDSLGQVYFSQERRSQLFMIDNAGRVRPLTGTSPAPTVVSGQDASELPNGLLEGIRALAINARQEPVFSLANELYKLSSERIFKVAATGTAPLPTLPARETPSEIISLVIPLALDAGPLAIRGDGTFAISANYTRSASFIGLLEESGPFDIGNGERLVASRDGSRLFHFNDAGRHLETLDALTHAPLFEFRYDQDRIDSIVDYRTDPVGQLIDLGYNGEEVSITAAYGETTRLGLDGDDHLSAVTYDGDPDTATDTFTIAADGLLSQRIDRRGITHTYTYDSDGRLTSDQRQGFGAGGGWTLSSGPLEFSELGVELDRWSRRTITLDSSGTFSKSHRITSYQSGRQTREVTFADGTTTTTERFDQQRRYERTSPAGTQIRSLLQNDPHLRAEAPILRERTVTYPSGHQQQMLVEAKAQLDPNDPTGATIVSRQQTTKRVVDPAAPGATRDWQTDSARQSDGSWQITVTTPEGRQSRRTFDPRGRLIETSLPQTAVAPLHFEYGDAADRGRLIRVIQGTLCVTAAECEPGDLCTDGVCHDPNAGPPRITRYEYSPTQADPLRTIDAFGLETDYEYNALNQPIRTVLADGKSCMPTTTRKDVWRN